LVLQLLQSGLIAKKEPYLTLGLTSQFLTVRRTIAHFNHTEQDKWQLRILLSRCINHCAGIRVCLLSDHKL